MAVVERTYTNRLSPVTFNPLRDAESLQVSLKGTEVKAATFRHQAREAHIFSAKEAARIKEANQARDAAARAQGKGTKFSAAA